MSTFAPLYRQVSATAQAESRPAERKFGHTTKKKNTYVVKLNGLLAQPRMFAGCRQTPMPVARENGRDFETSGAWMASKQFPNPNAQTMVTEYKNLSGLLGKYASTIIEYMDKDNPTKPVLLLFPTTVYIFDGYESDYMDHLNHASRRDFMHQLDLRRQMINSLTDWQIKR